MSDVLLFRRPSAAAVERHAIIARRLAHQGEVAQATERFADLLPHAAKFLEPERFLRFLGLYLTALRKGQVLEIERLRMLIEEKLAVWRHLVEVGAANDPQLRRRFESSIETLRLLTQAVGPESAPGRELGRMARALQQALV
ncbi:MAG: hypothetical protein AAGN46_16495 [Acidobacteriota bacterium]